jgi:hypothetical protein
MCSLSLIQTATAESARLRRELAASKSALQEAERRLADEHAHLETRNGEIAALKVGWLLSVRVCRGFSESRLSGFMLGLQSPPVS